MATSSWSEFNPVAPARQYPSVISSIIQGNEHVQSFSQKSQYRAGGVSSCGLAALNCVRVAFKNGSDTNKLQALLAAETTDEILKISDEWTGSSHLEVDELLRLPLFDCNLRLISTDYAEVSMQKLLPLLRQLEEREGVAAAVITRPPEIVVCLKVPVPEAGHESISPSQGYSAKLPSHVFVIFDSHPRSSHPDGAGWLFNTSIYAAAHYLHSLLAVDRHILDDPHMQWQAQLMNQFSGHIIVPQQHQKSSAFDDSNVQRLIWDTSFHILKLQAQLADAKLHNETIESVNKKYVDEQENLRTSESAARRRIEELERSNEALSRRLLGSMSRSSGLEISSMDLAASLGRQENSNHPSFASSSQQIVFDHPESTSLKSKGKQRDTSLISPVPQLVIEQEAQIQHDHMKALLEQRKYEEEALQLERERQSLAAFTQITFTCGICLDVTVHEDLSLIEKCSHRFCRECLQNYTLSKIRDRRFPIVCPICMSDRVCADPGIVEHDLIEQMNIPSKDYEILEEIMLSRYCIPLHCLKCSRTAFVDREEYQEQDIVACPLPGCTHAWCKHCTQSIEFDGPRHSCDGSNELANLMQKKGWKACPGCKTNIQKTDGCNHMTCPSPGCNMHFCYRCGEGIVQSALGRDAEREISRHYRVCQLFEHVPDHNVPP